METKNLTGKKKITVTVTEAQLRGLDKLAEKRKVSRADILRQIIDYHT